MELHSNGAAAKKEQSRGKEGEETTREAIGKKSKALPRSSRDEGTESVISSDADRSDLGSSIIRWSTHN